MSKSEFMNIMRPHMANPKIIGVFPGQQYYFAVDDRGMGVWARALCVLDDVKEFHEILNAENITLLINNDLGVSFPHDVTEDHGPVYSRLVKKMWDTPPVRAVLDDFEIVAWNMNSERPLR